MAEGAIKAVVVLLQDDRLPSEVKEAAAGALGSLVKDNLSCKLKAVSEGALKPLAHLIQTLKYDQRREPALVALGALVKDVRAIQAKALDEGVVQALQVVLNSGGGSLADKESALWALGCLASKNSKECLVRIIKPPVKPFWLRDAVDFFARNHCNNGEVLEKLLGAISMFCVGGNADENWAIRDLIVSQDGLQMIGWVLMHGTPETKLIVAQFFATWVVGDNPKWAKGQSVAIEDLGPLKLLAETPYVKLNDDAQKAHFILGGGPCNPRIIP